MERVTGPGDKKIGKGNVKWKSGRQIGTRWLFPNTVAACVGEIGKHKGLSSKGRDSISPSQEKKEKEEGKGVNEGERENEKKHLLAEGPEHRKA